MDREKVVTRQCNCSCRSDEIWTELERLRRNPQVLIPPRNRSTQKNIAYFRKGYWLQLSEFPSSIAFQRQHTVMIFLQTFAMSNTNKSDI